MLVFDKHNWFINKMEMFSMAEENMEHSGISLFISNS